MKLNPVKMLVDHYGYSLRSIHRASGVPTLANHTLHQWYHAAQLPDNIHSRLFGLTLVTWGDDFYHDRDRLNRNLLWQCYFEGKPHIYQYLHFGFFVGLPELREATGYSSPTLNKIMRQPKTTQPQLRAIGRYAMDYIADLSSRKRRAGPDVRRSSVLHRAVHDSARMYAKGEIP